MRESKTQNRQLNWLKHGQARGWLQVMAVCSLLLLVSARTDADTDQGCFSVVNSAANYCAEGSGTGGCINTALSPTEQSCGGSSEGYHCYTYTVTGNRITWIDHGECYPECSCSCEYNYFDGYYTVDITQAYNDDTACY